MIGSDSVVVVDTFQIPAAAEKLLATIHQKTTLPVRFVVNTHYHFDHVAGNGVFAAAGATVLAHQNVRRWERTENLLRGAIAKAQSGGAGSDAVVKAVLPQLKAKYGDGAFPEFAEPDIQRTDEELRGVKRLPSR